MEFLGFKTIDSIPALHHPELDLIVVSDLHLGLEGSMTSEGSYVPKFQLQEVVEELERAQRKTGADRLLINGDLKNEFRKSYYSEKQEVRKLMKETKDLFEEVIVVEGNHDNFIEETVKEQDVKFEKEHLEKGVLFIHGHEEPGTEDFETMVIGHEHPALSLKDEIGVVEKVDCALYGKTENGKDIVVLPAFSSISNGTRINETPSSELLSPVLRNRVNMQELHAIAISREAGVLEFPEIGKI